MTQTNITEFEQQYNRLVETIAKACTEFRHNTGFGVVDISTSLPDFDGKDDPIIDITVTNGSLQVCRR